VRSHDRYSTVKRKSTVTDGRLSESCVDKILSSITFDRICRRRPDPAFAHDQSPVFRPSNRPALANRCRRLNGGRIISTRTRQFLIYVRQQCLLSLDIRLSSYNFDDYFGDGSMLTLYIRRARISTRKIIEKLSNCKELRSSAIV